MKNVTQIGACWIFASNAGRFLFISEAFMRLDMMLLHGL